MNSKNRELRSSIEIQHQKNNLTIVKLGDASIASPFTARRTSIECVLSVLRQGRCTLVTTIQVYKVLALNCLVSAYMMSSLYLQGLKQGDTQMTVIGLVTAGMFYFISTVKPLTHLSENKPPQSVFNFSILLSIFGQFIVHIVSLILVLLLCNHHKEINQIYYQYLTTNQTEFKHEEEGEENNIYYRIDHPIIDSKFQPNLINTSVYFLYTTIQLNNFFVNYRGHPFTQNIQENILFCRSLQLLYFLIFILVTGIFEPFNDLLELVLLPSLSFQYILSIILILDLGLCYGIEKLSQKYEK